MDEPIGLAKELLEDLLRRIHGDDYMRRHDFNQAVEDAKKKIDNWHMSEGLGF